MRKTEVTLKDIAREIGVSVATVDRALHNRGEINAETKQRILEKASSLGYRPNMLARSLVMKKQFRVAVILPEDPAFFWSEMRDGVAFCSENLAPLGIRPEFFSYSRNDYLATAKYVKYCIEEQVDAIILKPYDVPVVIDVLNECAAKDIKIAMLNDMIPSIEHVLYVGPNDMETGLAAGQMMSLFLKGCTPGKIAIVRDVSMNSYSFKQRYAYFYKQVKKTCPQFEIFDISEELNAQFGRFDVYQITQHYIENYSDVVAIYNDSGTLYEVGSSIKDNAKRKIVVIGHEVSPRNNDLLKDGCIDAIISQDPFSQGYYAMKMLGDYLMTGTPPMDPIYLTHTDIIIKSNASYYRRTL